MIGLDLGKAMRDAQADPQAMTEIMRRVAEPLGATDMVVYLVDFAQTVLAPMPDRGAHVDLLEQEAVIGSMAGRAFSSGVATSS